MKIYEFRLSFHFIQFVSRVRTNSISSDNGLSPTRRQAIIWTNDGQFTEPYRRYSASLS